MAIGVSAYASVPATFNSSWGLGNCSPQPGDTFSYSYNLFKDGSSYDSGTTTNISRSWTNLPTGSYYLTVTGVINGSNCDSGTSIEILVNNYCLPSTGQLSMGKLADFYGLSRNNTLLSGTSNPSAIGSIFGNSDLPSTGTISKTRPNAISELYSRCGGVSPWNIEDGTNNIIDFRLISSNFLVIPFTIRANTSGGSILAEGITSSQGCNYYQLLKGFSTTPATAFHVSFTIQNPNGITENLLVSGNLQQINNLGNNQNLDIEDYNQSTNKSYSFTTSLTLNTSLKYRLIILADSTSCSYNIQ
jgi:hypothetical protein